MKLQSKSDLRRVRRGILLPYKGPELREFGSVGNLTQSGTGNAAEGMGQQSGDPTRKP